MSYQVARALKSITLVLLLLLNANQLVAQGSEPAIQLWSATERARIFSFGPWPVPNTGLDSPQRRRMNPLAGEPRAIAFGEHLFKDVRLSANGKVSCETCHQAKFGFTDGRARALGLAESHRNTMPLFDLAEQRWFGWDGGADSLWAATIRPLLDPKEMGGTPESIAKAIALHPPYRPYVQALQPLFPGGSTPRKSEDTTLVIAAMSLAAWMETIESERSAFDQYRDALLLNTPSPRPPGSTPSNAPAHTLKGSPSNFSAQAEKGLKLFIGKANCWLCHGGPRFTHGEFHDIGRPFLVTSKGSSQTTEVDPGRYRGIERVKRDVFNMLGVWSPDPQGERAHLLEQTILQHRNWGEWKIPTLRNLKQTAPYMHDGSLKSLREVVLHYSELNEERLHADGEALLKPLRLTTQEVDNLVAFLESLSP